MTAVTDRALGVTWTAPDGTVTDLNQWGRIHLLPDVDGLGAAPRATTRRALGTGGTFARWAHADERLITLPLLLVADDPNDFTRLRRDLTRAFTATTPAAGTPRPGTLRIARPDGTWRQVSCVYVDGLGWNEADGSGADHATAVVQLVAPDPWFYGPETVALRFGDTTVDRSYFAPYETVSPGRTLGNVTVNVDSDVAVDPVWKITGPATSVTIRYDPNGPGITYGTIPAGSTITVDVANSAVVDQTGANKIGSIGWPTSTLFQLQPGTANLLVSIIGGQPGQSGIELSFAPRFESA